jgi:hypothetical protein
LHTPVCVRLTPLPSCYPTDCCVDQKGFGCFKRRGLQFAECLPHSRQTVDGVCTDSENWLCPGWWDRPPAPPPAPPPLGLVAPLELRGKSQQRAIVSLTTMLTAAAVLLLLVGLALYRQFQRRWAGMETHVTSVVDDDDGVSMSNRAASSAPAELNSGME